MNDSPHPSTPTPKEPHPMQNLTPRQLRVIFLYLYGKFGTESPAPIIPLRMDELLQFPQSAPEIETLILSGRTFHLTTTPEPFDLGTRIRTSLEITGLRARATWALHPVPFDSPLWQQNWPRLSSYLDFTQCRTFPPPPDEPIPWPSADGRAGMIWPYSIEGRDLFNFCQNLAGAIRFYQKLSLFVLNCAYAEDPYPTTIR